jgi:hypothetical protein
MLRREFEQEVLDAGATNKHGEFVHLMDDETRSLMRAEFDSRVDSIQSAIGNTGVREDEIRHYDVADFDQLMGDIGDPVYGVVADDIPLDMSPVAQEPNANPFANRPDVPAVADQPAPVPISPVIVEDIPDSGEVSEHDEEVSVPEPKSPSPPKPRTVKPPLSPAVTRSRTKLAAGAT